MAERISLTNINIRSELRTKEMFNNHVENITIDPSLSSTYGIACDLCLYSLKYFHAVDGLPPDFAHDVLEGFAKDLTVDLILYLIDNKYISLAELNKEIITYPYSDVDKKNKPQVIQDKPASQIKVRQTAIEMWNFLRLLPFFIGEKIPSDDSCWKNFILFRDVVDRLGAPSFSKEELLILANVIDEFLEDYLQCYSKNNLKPKCHFL